jgi:hypothetical protein
MSISSLRFLGVCAAALLSSSAAIADTVDQPGPISGTIDDGSSIKVGTVVNPVGGIANPSTISGTVDANGNLSFPVSGVQIAPTQMTVNGLSLTTKISAMRDGIGTIDPLTGELHLSFALKVAISGVPFAPNCFIPQTNVVLSTTNAGGAAYDPATGKATVADGAFSVPAAQGCGFLTGLVNAQLGLPSSSGNLAVLKITVSPAVTGSVPPPATQP